MNIIGKELYDDVKMNYDFLKQNVMPDVSFKKVQRFEEKIKLFFTTLSTPRAGIPFYVKFLNQKPSTSVPKSIYAIGSDKAKIFTGHQTLLRDHAPVTDKAGEPLSHKHLDKLISV